MGGVFRWRTRAAAVLALAVGGVLAVAASPAWATTEPPPQPLRASKTAVPSWERTFKWTIDKSVSPSSHTLESGKSGTSTYTVAVTKSLDSEIVKVSGEVCVENVGAEPTENLTITDRLQVDTGSGFVPGEFYVVQPIDVSANPVLDPGESHCYPYTIVFTPVQGAVGYRNNAAIEITNDPRHPGRPFGPNEKVDFTLPAPTLVNAQVNVDDTNGMSWLFTDSGSQRYTKTFTCDRDKGTHVNTATIRETGQSDSATVSVTCKSKDPCPPKGKDKDKDDDKGKGKGKHDGKGKGKGYHSLLSDRARVYSWKGRGGDHGDDSSDDDSKCSDDSSDDSKDWSRDDSSDDSSDDDGKGKGKKHDWDD